MSIFTLKMLLTLCPETSQFLLLAVGISSRVPFSATKTVATAVKKCSWEMAMVFYGKFRAIKDDADPSKRGIERAKGQVSAGDIP
jgi:hypothetical protein